MTWQKSGQRIFNILQQDQRLRAGSLSYLLSIIFNSYLWINYDWLYYILYSIGISILLIIVFKWQQNMYTIQGYFIGIISSISMIFMHIGDELFPLYLYVYLMSLFHIFEFFAIGISNPESMKPDSFLLNHSVAYWLATAFCVMEFLVRGYYIGYTLPIIMRIGVLFCIVGETLRKLAMWHAGTGFTHLVAYRKHKQHSLVTVGVYSFVRHPAYLGFFLFTIGTQMILCNPICFFGFAYVCIFKFFKERIYEEERYLIAFFGRQYIQYQRTVPLGLPFIQGYASMN